MRKVSINTVKGKELEISPGSHLYYKKADGSEVYHDWQEIKRQHAKLQEVFDKSLELLARIKSIVPE